MSLAQVFGHSHSNHSYSSSASSSSSYFSPPDSPLSFIVSTIDASQNQRESSPSEKRKRKSAPKSKLGCVTCKERHVKCDETRPGCKRCMRTGRVCGGYVEVPRKSSHRIAARPHISPKSASPSVTQCSTPSMSPAPSDKFCGGVSAEEMEHLEYFRLRAAQSFPGAFDGDFWTGILLQASRQEPCVRYAMIALSSMHRHFVFSTQQGESPAMVLSKPETTLIYYDKAITALSERISKGDCSVSTILMCCTLFICLETIQGDSDAFFGHVRNGQNLIIQWRSKQQGKVQEASQNDDRLIEQHLVPFLARQDDFASCFLNQDMCAAESLFQDNNLFNPAYQVPSAFISLEEARDSFAQLKDAVIAFARFNQATMYSSYSNADQLRRLQVQLRGWRAAFAALRHRAPAHFERNATATAIAAMLEIQYCATDLWLATALTPDRPAYDDFFDSFQAVINLAPTNVEALIAQNFTVDCRRTTAWGTALVPQLVFSAMMCKDSSIRTGAMDLLRGCVERYGLSANVAPMLMPTTENWLDMDDSALPMPLTPPQSDFDPLFDLNFSVVDPTLESLNLDMSRMSSETPQIQFPQMGKGHDDRNVKPWSGYEQQPWFEMNDIFV